MSVPDFSAKYTIDTPENVTFGYDIAGIGSRFIGALIDTTLIVLLLLLLNVLLAFGLAALGSSSPDPVATDVAEDPGWVVGLLLAIYGLLTFAVIWGYYLAFELGWSGQTPGKRLAGTQVVKTDGAPATFLEVAIRNLVRIVDFLPAAYAIGVVTMFFNREARRLGDYAAGTLVIKVRRGVRLEELGTTDFRTGTDLGRSPRREAAAGSAFSGLAPTARRLWRANQPCQRTLPPRASRLCRAKAAVRARRRQARRPCRALRTCAG